MRKMLKTVAIVPILLLATLSFAASSNHDITVAQLSDLHLGMTAHPGSEQRLQQAIAMLKGRHLDAVIVTGDIGDNFEQSWREARAMLAALNVPVYYAPGNHDVTAKTVSRYERLFNHDFYTFTIKGIHFIVLDSELLGNFSHFASRQPELPAKEDESAAEKMLDWLNGLHFSGPVIAVQHVPPDRSSPHISPDDKPYWILHDPWRTRELNGLRKLGVKDILAGHWHQGTIYQADGFTFHIAPATSWSPKSKLGFAIDTISPSGQVKTKFIYFEQQPFLK
jgi:predicted MPP superfamily phosphohydrolase